ncbi:MAG: hypothetical protein EA427_04000 [Spirochaetaceae bacterium]|nr:MAG: hypothetical protein EA427_04000 [Spirochaetaceae bacterium]
MGCTERTFFGLPIVREAPPDLAEAWGQARNEPGILFFARRPFLWRLVRSSFIRDALAGKRAAVVPVGTSGRRVVRLATGCDTGDFAPFNAPIRILSRAEIDGAGVFIVHTNPAAVRRMEENLKVTFPDLRIVGRAVFNADIAPSVTTAIRKSDPRIVLIGSVRMAVIRWVLSQYDSVGNALALLAADAADRIAERDRSIIPGEVLTLPLRILTIPLLLAHRLVLVHRKKSRA